LRFRIVHDNDVAHPRSRRSAPYNITIHYQDAHALPRALVRARGADDPSTHDNRVVVA
jgi:hypothetical protein